MRAESSEAAPDRGRVAWWQGPGFREELLAFVTPVIGAPTAVEEIKTRAWSTVWRLTARDGRRYVAKQGCPSQRFEPALAVRLAEIAPELVVPVTAAAPATGLLLTPDLGPTLADGPTGVEDWQQVVALHARLQRRVLPELDSLALGSAPPGDSAPGALTAYVEEMLDVFGRYADDDPRGLSSSSAGRVREALPRLEDDVAQVAEVGLPVSIDHNDVHPGNVLRQGGDLRFFDFGDAVRCEPLGSLNRPLSQVRDQEGLDTDDPALMRIADAALEHWSDLATMAELRAALPAASRVGMVRAVVPWLRILADAETAASVEELGDFASAGAETWPRSVAEPGDGGLRPRSVLF